MPAWWWLILMPHRHKRPNLNMRVRNVLVSDFNKLTLVKFLRFSAWRPEWSPVVRQSG